MPGGRPSTYSKELADAICERLACGESMRSICKDDAMPAMSTFFKWLREHEEFSKLYAIAKEECAETLFDEILDIADNSTNDWMENNDPDNPGYRLNGEAIQRARLRVDTRKWAASKLKPKKYGERVTQDNISSDGSMSPMGISAAEKLKELLDGIAERGGKTS